MSLNTNWSYPTSIRFGAGRIKELGEACIAAGMQNPLLVTDPGIAQLPMTRQAMDIMLSAGLKTAMFSDVQSNPTGANVDAGLHMMRTGNHDGVVAFGGGSGLDAGKVIAFMSGQTRPMWDFEDVDDWWTRADPDGIAPIVAVPTTAGTGSEVGRAGVITNAETHTKKIIFHPKMLPHTVICDAELTIGLPPVMTAGTGYDAFVHCLEAYCSPAYHPMSAGIAVEGMRLVKQYLPRAYRDGTDVEARAHMLSAAAMGAVAFQKGLGGIHALSHPVGALYNTHHGLTNAMFTPYVLRANRSAIEQRIDRLAAWLGIDGGFDGFMQYVIDLRRELAIPNTLGELGVDNQQFELIAAMAVEDPSASGNPIPVTVAGCLQLLDAAWSGRLSG
jgi:alcohol dehydrogenase class IV